MDKAGLVEKIKSLGAFIPEKLIGLDYSNLTYPQFRNLALETALEHSSDINIGAGAIYLSHAGGMGPEAEAWALQAREFFRSYVLIEPKNPVELNNKAFAYENVGLCGDATTPMWARTLIAQQFGVKSFKEHVQPLYEASIWLKPDLWEPRYNLGETLADLAYSDHFSHEERDLLLQRPLEEFEKIIEIDPKNILARLQQATFFPFVYGRMEKLGEVLLIDPDNEEAKERIAGLHEAGYNPQIHSVGGTPKVILSNTVESPDGTIPDENIN